MKSSLLFSRLASAILLLSVIHNLSAQSVVFSEDFSGFTTGTHASPSTYDASGSLDTRTSVPGWTGFKVYSAGGEIKLGTADVPGWIETPEIDLSGHEGDLFLKFDISGWPDNAASVRVLLNGAQIGNTISPSDQSQTIEIPVPDGTVSGKIKFESLVKRFYLDNIQVIEQNATGLNGQGTEPAGLKIYPNPASDRISINNVSAYCKLAIYDLYGREASAMDISGTNNINVELNDLSPGLYVIRLFSGRSVTTSLLIKY